jgi:hypothetical protein
VSYGFDDHNTVYDENLVKARKAHQCGACKESILPGHIYVRVGIVFDGSASSVKRCLRCQKLHEHLRTKCATSGDDVWPAEELDCGLSYEGEWGELPEEIAVLAFQTGADLQPGKLG